MPQSPVSQKQLLLEYQFRQGGSGGQVGAVCDDCEKPCAGKRSWWLRISYQPSELVCLCHDCAVAYCEHYEFFDAD